jgi:hypothetical protein
MNEMNSMVTSKYQLGLIKISLRQVRQQPGRTTLTCKLPAASEDVDAKIYSFDSLYGSIFQLSKLSIRDAKCEIGMFNTFFKLESNRSICPSSTTMIFSL